MTASERVEDQIDMIEAMRVVFGFVFVFVSVSAVVVIIVIIVVAVVAVNKLIKTDTDS